MGRKKKPPEHVNHERWLVSYADFVTLLFAFFTTLYAISVVDQKKMGALVYSMRTAFNVEVFETPKEVTAYQGIQQAVIVQEGPPGIGSEGGDDSVQGENPVEGSEEERMAKVEQDIQGIIESLKLEKHVTVRLEDRGLVVSMAEAGFFSSGSAVMDDEAKALVDRLAARLANEKFGVMVEGHTDNRPIRSAQYHSNWELSTSRATNVVAHMVDHKGFDAQRLSAAGYAEHRPVAGNDTEEGRTKNRRVDLVVVFQHADTSPKAPPKAPSDPPTPTPTPPVN